MQRHREEAEGERIAAIRTAMMSIGTERFAAIGTTRPIDESPGLPRVAAGIEYSVKTQNAGSGA